ncbi:hypothetical protein [Ruegeria sediminis]|uniref:hypothetical protein n=1 Tax=Ruegeria sediminis TaxID=2583820 RepID=UPI00148699B7|nr:hypothetical protein [Ruegeria sediminis]
MSKLEQASREIVETTEKLYDLSMNPLHFAEMRQLTTQLEKALAAHARAMSKNREMGF